MTVTIVAAVSSNGVIGRDGDMPWHLPEDLRRYRRLTLGHPMVMGRKTFESIGRVLPGRTSIVVTRDPSWSHPGVLTTGSLAAALRMAAEQPGGDTIMVAGGGEIYAQAMPSADCLEITRVHQDVAGDTVFPQIDRSVWKLDGLESNATHDYGRYVRRTPADTELQRLGAALTAEREPDEN